MSFLDDLGLGDIISSVREMTTEITGLKDDIISSVVDPVTGLQDTVQDISSGITGDATSVSAPADATDSN